MANMTALNAAVKLICDAAKDATSGGRTILAYENLVSDLLTLVPQLGELPSELKSMEPADYAALMATAAGDLAATGKEEAILTAAVALLTELATGVAPKLEALLASCK